MRKTNNLCQELSPSVPVFPMHPFEDSRVGHFHPTPVMKYIQEK